jgi:cytochrome c biogenesis protein CcdA
MTAKSGRLRALSLEFALIIAGLGLVDSLNPATITVGAILAATEHPVRRLAGYAAGIFCVYLLGGLVLTLGPAELLRTALHGPGATTARDIVFIVVGLVAIGFAVWVFVHRDTDRLKDREFKIKPGSAFLLGAGITAVDIPTAFPYFGAIAAMVARDVSTSSKVGLLVLFNLMYILPILVVLGAAAVLHERARPFMARVREFVVRWSPILLSLLTLGVGIALTVDGVKGLALD